MGVTPARKNDSARPFDGTAGRSNGNRTDWAFRGGRASVRSVSAGSCALCASSGNRGNGEPRARMTRRRGSPPAHRPSGRDPGCGFASDRAIPPPSQAGVGFGLWLGSPVWFCWSLGQREIKLRRNQGPTAWGVALAKERSRKFPPPRAPCWPAGYFSVMAGACQFDGGFRLCNVL